MRIDEWAAMRREDKVAGMTAPEASIDVEFFHKDLLFILSIFHPYGHIDRIGVKLVCFGAEGIDWDDHEALTYIFGHEYPNEFLHEWYEVENDLDAAIALVDHLTSGGRNELYQRAEDRAATFIERRREWADKEA